jgi:2-oxoglutarate dehydrogenase E2 component (dihydrolipoamide succinyltransferase)
VLQVLFAENALVPVGEVIAVINTEGKGEVSATGGAAATSGVTAQVSDLKQQPQQPQQPQQLPTAVNNPPAPVSAMAGEVQPSSGRFYSPLVMSIASRENISGAELDSIAGSGTNGRVRKQDVLKYLENRTRQPAMQHPAASKGPATPKVSLALQPGDEIVEMDRMRKLIADHMVMSKHTSPHVTNFVEADVTNLVLWRERAKDEFLKREKIKLTFMPAFLEASAKALREFPGVNASVDDYKIILRKNVNIGFAVALKSGNLIVPVVKQADQKSLIGLAVELNRLAEAARSSSLSPDDIQGGTFTISNFGTFRNITGTPVINQPQVAILATGNIEKKPAVIETPTGDVIAIRHKMILSLSYDHRVVDGALGGMFLRRIADLLEEFQIDRTF